MRLHELMKVKAETIDLDALEEARLIGHAIERVKVIASGQLTAAVVLKGIAVTRGARIAIEAAGGRIEA